MDRIPQPITRAIMQVKRFQEEVLGVELPAKPERLSTEGKQFIRLALMEELKEMDEAETIEDEADALIDAGYFIFGRLVRMGLMPSVLFDVVHDANMQKKRGELKKERSLPGEHEAMKPAGWQAPDHTPYLLTREQVEQAANIMLHGLAVDHSFGFALHDAKKGEPLAVALGMPGSMSDWSPLPPVRPKVLIMGYGRHGKDTVSEMLGKHYGLKFQSSSQFCADKVVFPLFSDDDKRVEFLQRMELRVGHEQADELRTTLDKYLGAYANAVECFERRHEEQGLRTLWYEAIRDFNRTDQAALGRGIFAENDIYCGIRSSTEFHAVKNQEVANLIVWVDASERVPPEDRRSITVEPWMADFVIDNNNGLAELERNVFALFDACGFQRVR